MMTERRQVGLNSSNITAHLIKGDARGRISVIEDTQQTTAE